MMVCNEACSVGGVQVSRSMAGELPLMDRGVEAIAAVENIRVRHVIEIALAEARGIHAGAVRVPGPRALLQDRVGAVRLRWRVRERTEDAEVSKLAVIWGAVRVFVRALRGAGRIDGMNDV